ncbi:MAG: DUF4097 family beta strand repeat protein [Lachnospiraceae bacterium]|nr:DUF4097 family beta strand repeat protein [Lachnospiraceae bacterium]
MKKAKKIAIIVAVCMIAVGFISAFTSFASVGFDVAKVDTVEWKTNTYEIKESFENISVEGLEAKVTLVPSTDGTCKVVCTENDNVYDEVKVENDTLTIKRTSKGKWQFNFGVSLEEVKITVYLPKTEYKKLVLNNTSGRLEVPTAFTFEEAKVANSSGKIIFKADVTGALSVENTSGGIDVGENQVGSLTVAESSGGIQVASVHVENDVQASSTSGGIHISEVECKNIVAKGSSGSIRLSSIVAKENLEVDGTSGSIQLTDVECANVTGGNSSGSIKCSNVIASGNMELENSSGGISFEACDATNLKLSATSGSIRGNLLTPKNFVADATSGSVDVPQSASGGLCEASTTSGSIHIRVGE